MKCVKTFIHTCQRQPFQVEFFAIEDDKAEVDSAGYLLFRPIFELLAMPAFSDFYDIGQFNCKKTKNGSLVIKSISGCSHIEP